MSDTEDSDYTTETESKVNYVKHGFKLFLSKFVKRGSFTETTSVETKIKKEHSLVPSSFISN